MRTDIHWPAWFYRHPDGQAQILPGPDELEELLDRGEIWKDHPPHSSRPAGDTAASGQESSDALPLMTPADRPPGVPPASEIYAQNTDLVTTLIAHTSNPDEVIQIIADEYANPEHPGGRKGVMEAAGQRIVAFIVADLPDPATPPAAE